MPNAVVKYVSIIMIFIAFIFFMMYGGPSLNLSQDSTEDIIAAMPGIFIFTISIITLTRVHGSYLLIGMLGMGTGLSILIYTLYNTGLIIDSMLWGLTLEQNMALIIVLCGIIGGILVAASRD